MVMARVSATCTGGIRPAGSPAPEWIVGPIASDYAQPERRVQVIRKGGGPLVGRILPHPPVGFGRWLEGPEQSGPSEFAESDPAVLVG